MSNDEIKEIFDAIWPVGGQRWIKVKIHDQGKAMETFRFHKSGEVIFEYGVEATAIGRKPENVPQISAILDARDKVVSLLHGRVSDHVLDEVRDIFKLESDEVKRRSIIDGEHIIDLRSQLLEGNKKPQYPQLLDHADFETWCVFNEKELDCIFAESGADREMDFDREAEEMKIWESVPRIKN